MNEQKIKYLKNNIKFHFEDLSIDRQLEIKARPEPIEWKYLALGEDTLENIEKFGVKGWDNLTFRNRIDSKLKVLNKEDDKQFAKAYAAEFRKGGVWVAEDVARHKFERMQKYWEHFGGEEFEDENNHKTYTFTFNDGVTLNGMNRLFNLMASTRNFEELTQDEWFVLWTTHFTEIIKIQPRKIEKNTREFTDFD